MKANSFHRLHNNAVKCTLCPHECIIQNDKYGICRVRKNSGGDLIAETSNLYSAVNFDPIEKKPLFHFCPGNEILSLGSVGCNLRCRWCQNCEISQKGSSSVENLKYLSPGNILKIATQRENNIGVAYTYNEPSIQFETIAEVAGLISSAGLKNVMVTNGYFNRETLKKYITLIDAFNVDIKSFNEIKHRKYTGGALEPVLNSIKQINSAGKHLELTYLVVPEVNDSHEEFKSLINWIYNEIGERAILHISRFFPRHKWMKEATDPKIIENFANLASTKIRYVYTGNVQTNVYADTFCVNCNKKIISRLGYSVVVSGDVIDGRCPGCGEKIFYSC